MDRSIKVATPNDNTFSTWKGIAIGLNIIDALIKYLILNTNKSRKKQMTVKGIHKCVCTHEQMRE